MRAHDEDGSVCTDRETARLMAECDVMEAEFAKWFDRTATLLARRRVDRSMPDSGAFDPSLCRGLLLLWATSPAARARYSDEARRGLVAAADSMTDRTFIALLSGIVAESRAQSQRATAA
jgi:hypothetical protein